MNLIQLFNSDGNESGLYMTVRTDDVQGEFDKAFEKALELENDQNPELINEEGFDLHSAVDEILEEELIYRTFADGVNTDKI